MPLPPFLPLRLLSIALLLAGLAEVAAAAPARVPAAGRSREAFGPPQAAHPFAPRRGEVGPPAPPMAADAPSATVAAAPGCLDRLRALRATFEPATTPRADAACIVADPVRLASVAVSRKGGEDVVRLAGAPLLSCEMALAVTDWVQTAVAPLARGHFDEPLTEMLVGGGFECRQRNHQAGAPRSEHSFGRALDVMGFRTGSRTITVEKPPAEARPFVEAVWAAGCGRFSTALGPEADTFHANHIHLDLQPRRSAGSKVCQ